MSYFSFGSMQNTKKCAVIGCGGVGSTVAYTLSQSKQIDALVLIDPDQRTSNGVAADLNCALASDSRLDLWAGDYADLSGCTLIILTLGQHRIFENTHADLSAQNLPIIRKAVADITAYNNHACIIVLSEPCEVMTYQVMCHAGIPHQRVIGIGTLPHTLYLRRMLANYLSVDPRQLDAMILGESDIQGAFLLDSIRICGYTPEQYLTSIGRHFDQAMMHSFFEDAMHAFERAQDVTGCAQYATARACALVAESILSDANTILPLCTTTEGIGDLAGACLSVPCIVNKHGARAMLDHSLSLDAYEKLRRSASKLHGQMIYDA